MLKKILIPFLCGVFYYLTGFSQTIVRCKMYLIVAAIFCISNFYAQINLDSGLVAYYPFNGNANDASGKGNNGVVFGATLTTDRFGNADRAYGFDGVDDFIQIQSSNSINSINTGLTIAGWAYPVDLYSNWIVILVKGNTSSMSTPYGVVYASSAIFPFIRFTSSNNVPVIVYLSGVTNCLTLNEWHFFTWRFSAGLLEIYRDGNKLGEYFTGIDTLKHDQLPIEIGRDVPGSTEFYYGFLDDIRIYNRAITQEEIDSLFNEQPAPATVIASVDNAAYLPENCSLNSEINVNMGSAYPPDNLLGSFDGSLSWNPMLFQYTGNSGFKNGIIGTIDTSDVSNGALYFAGAHPSGVGGNVEILDVFFNEMGITGEMDTLDLEFTAMNASTGANLLPILTVTDGSVKIIASGILGDVNEDGFANSTDALIILSYDAGLQIPPAFMERIESGFGDINADQNCNSTDALIILSYDVGITVPFPIGQNFCP